MFTKIRFAFFTASLAFVFAGCNNANMEDYPDAPSVFRATFNTSPPNDVNNLQGYGHVFRDNSACYLRFTSPFPTVQMLTGKTFKAITPDTFSTSTAGGAIVGPTPSWWTPPRTKTSTFYTSTDFHPDFSTGRAYLAYDSATQVAYVYWDGVD